MTWIGGGLSRNRLFSPFILGVRSMPFSQCRRAQINVRALYLPVSFTPPHLPEKAQWCSPNESRGRCRVADCVCRSLARNKGSERASAGPAAPLQTPQPHRRGGVKKAEAGKKTAAVLDTKRSEAIMRAACFCCVLKMGFDRIGTGATRRRSHFHKIQWCRRRVRCIDGAFGWELVAAALVSAAILFAPRTHQ